MELLYSSAAETREFVGVCGRKAWEEKQKKEKKTRSERKRYEPIGKSVTPAAAARPRHAHTVGKEPTVFVVG